MTRRRQSESSFGEPLCDGKAAADAERLGGDLQAGRGLLALVFVAIHFVDDVAHQLERQR